jgi:UDP-N-acetylmuramoylalanine--D-glutamate ligase
VCPCKIVAVTGSDGKTTTTSVIAKLLEKQGYKVYIGGNIGTPLLDKAGQMTENDIVVLELSSFQLMTMNCSPDIAVVTNVAPNHLDVHRDMQEYIDAKKNVFIHQNKSGRVVLNADNDITSDFVKEAKGEYFMFSRKRIVYNGVYCQNGVIYHAVNGTDTEIMKESEIFLPGVHNVENYMAAFAALRGLVSRENMRTVAMEFRGVEHRIELVREMRGVKYYNDSIASSPSRTTAGLRSFNQKVILIAGGKDKGVPFDSLGTEIVEHVKKLVLTGLTADKIRAAVENCPQYRGEPEIFTCDEFKEAIEKASSLAERGDVVILSPACTSFDRFKNFEERGNTFKAIVNELK